MVRGNNNFSFFNNYLFRFEKIKQKLQLSKSLVPATLKTQHKFLKLKSWYENALILK